MWRAGEHRIALMEKHAAADANPISLATVGKPFSSRPTPTRRRRLPPALIICEQTLLFSAFARRPATLSATGWSGVKWQISARTDPNWPE